MSHILLVVLGQVQYPTHFYSALLLHDCKTQMMKICVYCFVLCDTMYSCAAEYSRFEISTHHLKLYTRCRVPSLPVSLSSCHHVFVRVVCSSSSSSRCVICSAAHTGPRGTHICRGHTSHTIIFFINSPDTHLVPPSAHTPVHVPPQ